MFDPQHPEWPKFIAKVNLRISELQAELESPLDLDQTNRARGAIGELRRLVSDAVPIPTSETPRYS